MILCNTGNSTDVSESEGFCEGNHLWLGCCVTWPSQLHITQHMMTSSNGNIFRVTGPLCGNSPVPVNSPHKGQWRGALMFSLIWARINDWVNNRKAGDLRRHRGHCDVNVMILKIDGDTWTNLSIQLLSTKQTWQCCINISHYSDVAWGSWLQTTGNSDVIQQQLD